jgi:general secretion pathway protein B
VSFILDALRKSEHERQQSAVPGLSQVPLATPQPQLPRWAVVVMGVLAAVVLVVTAAWWQSTRGASELDARSPTVERRIELPTPPPSGSPQAAPSRAAPADALAPSREPSLEAAAGGATAPAATSPAPTAPARLDLPADAAALPSAAMLAAEGVPLPSLRLELHAFSAEPRDRFVFINGRKYVEGERLVEGPQVVSIAPTGAVLAHAGRRFLLVQD